MRTIHFGLEVLLNILFFSAVSAQGSIRPYRRLAVVFLLLQLPIFYMDAGLLYAILRIILRTLCFFGYLRARKGISVLRAIYFSILVSLCFTIANNLLMSPLLYFVRENPPHITPSVFLDWLLISCIGRYAAMAAILYLPYRLIPFDKINAIQKGRFGMLVMIICIELYVKETVYSLNTSGNVIYHQISAYLILLHIFLLLFAILMERSFCDSEQQAKLMLQESANTYRMRSLKAHQNGAEDVRRMHHDIKNHLLAIDRMADRANNTQICQYIHVLSGRMTEYEHCYDTGNTLLDGLLEAKKLEIGNRVKFYIDIHMPDLLEMDDADVCTIFGNIIDNSLEACHRVPAPEEGYMHIKGYAHADRFFITFKNNYYANGKIELRSGIPLTNKKSPYAHGYGLMNVRRTLEKYSGTFVIDLNTKGVFVLTISFPIPGEDGK